MRKLIVGFLVVGVIATSRASSRSEELDAYFPLTAAPEHHKPLLENEFVLVLDVTIPAGATVPAHLHPWPAVFITLEPAQLVFRNLNGDVVREVRPPIEPSKSPHVEWRTPDTEPASVTNVSGNAQRALRIELKFLGPQERRPTSR